MDANLERQMLNVQAQQASYWLEVMRAPTSEQRAEFLAWLKASPGNVGEFLVMFELDEQFSGVDSEHRHDLSGLIAEIRSAKVVPLKISALGQASRSERSPAKRWWLAAAGVAAVCFGTLAARHMGNDWRDFQTVTGEQRTFELPDGSLVNLNTNSHLSINFSSDAREIRLLQGEALFRVHHDATRPFRVRTTDAVVQALGTQFNVYSRGDATLVAVVEGRVAVAAAADSGAMNLMKQNRSNQVAPQAVTAQIRNLAANEEAKVGSNGVVQVNAAPDVSDSIAWRERRLIFHDQNLQQIIREFNRYNSEQIRLDESVHNDRRYSGAFDADDPEAFLKVLMKDPSLDIRTSGSGFLIKGRS